jgi:competence protein ComEA
MTMFYSLIIKLGMFAMTMGVVFWIGWTVPASMDRTRDLAASSSEEVQVEMAFNEENAPEVSPSPAGGLSDHHSTAIAPKRLFKGRLDLNRATKQDFDALPGVGPKLAERILKHRQSVGVFQSLDDLLEVKGIGKKTFERIRPLVTVTPSDQSVERVKQAT